MPSSKFFYNARPGIIVLLCWSVIVLLLSFLWLIRPPHGLTTHYYENPEWKGEPVFSHIAPQIDLQTMQQAVHDSTFPSRNISIAWKGWIRIDRENTYRFSTTSDDGSSIMINDTLVVDNGGFHGMREASGEIFLPKGLHRMTVSYFNGAGVAPLRVQWYDSGGIQVGIPSNILFPQNLLLIQKIFAQYSQLFSIAYSLSGIVLILLLINHWHQEIRNHIRAY